MVRYGTASQNERNGNFSSRDALGVSTGLSLPFALIAIPQLLSSLRIPVEIGTIRELTAFSAGRPVCGSFSIVFR